MTTLLLAGLGDVQTDAQYMFDHVSGNPALVTKPAYVQYMPTINALMKSGDYSNALTYLNYLGAQGGIYLPTGGTAAAAGSTDGGFMASIPWKKILIGGGVILALGLAIRWFKSRTKTQS